MGSLRNEITPQTIKDSDAIMTRKRCVRAKVTRREIIAEDLLEAVGELEEDAAVGNDPVAGAEAAHDLDRAILLRARLHRTLRELAGFLLHIDERLVLRIVQQGGYGHRENVLADS